MDGPWCAVVNALWEGRPVIDARVGLPPAAEISHRFRMSVFATARRPLELARRTLAELRPMFPGLPEGDDAWDSIRMEGGWVHGTEAGDLADPHAGLHRRDDVGVSVVGSYLTLNTGTYSLGPLLGREAAESALAVLAC